ncbi:uncharacterized protein LOC5519894 isoform X2 [Nematostella vectensis]|uniref:uncharacterized protein LOC5519894 isoform X2 n=1 Tax=Nematostella vectensis TaxID=45351 RepID=UPI002076FF41|nr:uncharacterized protein LOC5519894 isoform X2 [Nematostella vectensis]
MERGARTRPLPLTTENLKKFEKQFQNEDSGAGIRRRVPQRTAADGRSAKRSTGSWRSRGKKQAERGATITKMSNRAPTQHRRRSSNESFYRPARESVRRNPEGMSRNPSTVPTPRKPPVQYIKYTEEDLDDYIPYEDPKKMAEKEAAKRAMEEAGNKVVEEDSDAYVTSTAPSTPVTPAPRKKAYSTTDGSVRTSSSADSGDDDLDEILGDEDDDDDEEEEDEDKETTTRLGTTTPGNKSQISEKGRQSGKSQLSKQSRLSGKSQMSKKSRASRTSQISRQSSVVESVSSIPTIASVHESVISVDEKPPSVASSVPSYVLNKNEFAMKKFANEQERKRAKAGRSLTPESSISAFSNGTRYSRSSVREQATATVMSKGSYITIRNWTRWSNYSGGGYSISNSRPPSRRNPRETKTNTPRSRRSNSRKTPKSKKSNLSTAASDQSERSKSIASHASTSLSRSSSKRSLGRRSNESRKSGRKSVGLGGVLQISNYAMRSEPNLRGRKKSRALVVDEDISRSRPTSRPARVSVTRSALRSRKGNRTLSLPALPRSNANVTQKPRSRLSSRHKTEALPKIKPQSRQSTAKAPQPKKKNLKTVSMKPKEMENDVYGFDFTNRKKRIPRLSTRPAREATSFSSRASVVEPRRRPRKGDKNAKEPRPDDAMSTTSRRSQKTQRQIEQKKQAKRIPSTARSSAMSSSILSSQSRASMSTTSTAFVPRRSRSKQLRPLYIDDSGFLSDRCLSSKTSMRPPETPFSYHSSKTRRSVSLRSVVTEYSSYPSRAMSSRFSSRRGSEASLSLYTSSDEENTTIGPTATTVEQPKDDKRTRQGRKTPAPKQEKSAGRVRKSAGPSSKENVQEDSSGSDSKRLILPPISPTSSGKSSPYAASMRSMASSRKSELTQLLEEVKEKQRRKQRGEKEETAQQKERRERLFRINHPMPSFQEAYRDHGMSRFVKLARPKENKAVWMTSFWPINWGDQSMMWPVSKNALSYKGTPRLEELATPKKDYRLDHPDRIPTESYDFSCGRPSVILKVNPLAMKAEPSDRVVELAKPKQTIPEFEERVQRDNYVFSCGRSSPIWAVSLGAKTAEERERTMQLAQPKKPDARYRPCRDPIWPVAEAAKRGSPTPRVENLARPKTRPDGPFREPMWQVSSASRRAVASARVQELAKSKQLAEGYQPCRNVETPVPKSALRAIATDRTQSLSKPVVRETMDHVQFNPDAFRVSETALRGRVPDRVLELAQPFSRK